VLAITVDEENNSNIELVETKAAAGYLDGFTDPEFIKDLPKITFPNVPSGTYRGFEIRGDSMLPMEEGSVVICSYVERLADIKNGKTYVVVSEENGVVYKRLTNNPASKNLLLTSDNETYRPYELEYKEVSEIWQYYAHLSFNDSYNTFNQMIDEKLSELNRKITDIHQHVIS
jgi:phage repressor protein C with HTH and peptisase S24 domain